MYLYMTDILIKSQDCAKIFKCTCFMWGKLDKSR